MRKVLCQLSDDASIGIQVRDVVHTYTGGSVADLDQELAPATPETDEAPARPAVTLEAALGALVQHFAPHVEAPASTETE
jgi:hypothetical protein